MENVKALLKEIKSNLSQTSASQKDEVAVMRAMLNDTKYVVDVYGSKGKEGTVCPAEEARAFLRDTLAGAAKISSKEAQYIADNYEFKKSDAEHMVAISKEFVNTYLQTGRKLPLGGRAKSNISLAAKKVDASVRMFPKKVGDDKYEKVKVKVPGYESIKVVGPCPKWVK